MLNVYHFCLPLKVSNNVKVGFWIFSWSCWVVERLFPKNPKFLEIGNQVYISHLQQTGEYQTGPDCQTFYQSPNIHSIHSIPNIHRQFTKCQHTFWYSQSLIRYQRHFHQHNSFNKVFNNCDQYIRRCSQSKNSQTIFSEFKILSTNPVDVLCQPDMK